MNKLLVFLSNALIIYPMLTFAIPIYERQSVSWQDGSIVQSPCGSDDPCWGYLASVPVHRNNVEDIMHEDPNFLMQAQRRPNIGENVDVLGVDESSSAIRQITNKPVVKKDVFLSRSWGAGGMPFSVLYMNPHGTRQTHQSSDASKQTNESIRKTVDTTLPVVPQKNRVAVRNAGSNQPRKQYSIIPQLFISYGWGPLGK